MKQSIQYVVRWPLYCHIIFVIMVRFASILSHFLSFSVYLQFTCLPHSLIQSLNLILNPTTIYKYISILRLWFSSFARYHQYKHCTSGAGWVFVCVCYVCMLAPASQADWCSIAWDVHLLWFSIWVYVCSVWTGSANLHIFAIANVC